LEPADDRSANTSVREYRVRSSLWCARSNTEEAEEGEREGDEEEERVKRKEL